MFYWGQVFSHAEQLLYTTDAQLIFTRHTRVLIHLNLVLNKKLDFLLVFTLRWEYFSECGVYIEETFLFDLQRQLKSLCLMLSRKVNIRFITVWDLHKKFFT